MQNKNGIVLLLCLFLFLKYTRFVVDHLIFTFQFMYQSAHEFQSIKVQLKVNTHKIESGLNSCLFF